ncbi:MAG TPA: hypothetical protein VIE67_14305 [Rudaea sp.]|jgi:hypothetical protein|uniref:hypothetical protein n=1 Tax=Rudaea sp. TaxID=2136325 RepID=UPI002F932FE4
MNDLWGPIQASDWRSAPSVAGRPATEADVLAGAAVFYVEGDTAAVQMQLPCCAIHTLGDGSEESVVVIQAELGPQGTILGVRPLAGGNGVCLATEVRLLPNGFGS